MHEISLLRSHVRYRSRDFRRASAKTSICNHIMRQRLQHLDLGPGPSKPGLILLQTCIFRTCHLAIAIFMP